MSNPPDSPPSVRSSASTWLAWLLVPVLLGMRLWALDRLPGINGDEAWLALQAKQLVYGAAFSLRTPTHMFINPLLFGTEALLLALFEPSGWLLRLPIALWSLAGLLLFYVLHRRLWGDKTEALLTTVLLAAMPLHLAYSRLAWDPGFLLFAIALFWLPALHWLRGPSAERSHRLDLALLITGAVLLSWTHMTASLAWLTLGLGAWWLRKRSLSQWFGALTVALGGLGAIAWLGKAHLDPYYLWQLPLERLQQPFETLRMMAAPGQMLSGVRAFSFLAGMAETPVWWGVATAVTLLWMGLAFLLRRSTDEADKAQALAWLWLPLPWWAASGLLGQGDLGKERYVVWLLPPAVLLLVRTLRLYVRQWQPLVVVLATGLTLQSGGLLAALADSPWPDGQHRTFVSGPAEPKIAAAQVLVSAAMPGEQLRVRASDWWLIQPLLYLLPQGSVVAEQVDFSRFSVQWLAPGQQAGAGCQVVADGGGRPALQVCVQAAGKR